MQLLPQSWGDLMERNTPKPNMLWLVPWFVTSKEKATVSFDPLFCLVGSQLAYNSTQPCHPTFHPLACSLPCCRKPEKGWTLPLSPLSSRNAKLQLSPHTTKPKECNESRWHTRRICDELRFWSRTVLDSSFNWSLTTTWPWIAYFKSLSLIFLFNFEI